MKSVLIRVIRGLLFFLIAPRPRGVINDKGEILFHRNMRIDFNQFKKKMQPFCI